MALIDFFDRGWRIDPEAAAYIQDDRVYTFRETRELSCRIANALLSDGFRKETKGAVWAGNDAIAWTCALGLWRAAMTYIPVNARGTVEENQFALDFFDCEIVFFQQAFADMLEPARQKLQKVRLWVCIDGDVSWATSLAKWTEKRSRAEPRVAYDMDDVVTLSATGGTTGKPKGVMNTHRAFQTYFAQYMMAFPYVRGRPVNLAAAPMTHTAGMMSLPCSARGGTVVILTKPEPAPMLDAIARHRVTELFLPPTVIYRLLDIPGIGKADFSSLKYFLYGAAPMSVEKLKRAIEIFGPVMAGGYGQTEAAASISYLPPAEHFEGDRLASDERLSSVGRPNPLIRVEIISDKNEILPQGESGEICVRGDLVMKGYYMSPNQTAETIVDGWLHTGDIGHLDRQGYLHITDRKKDMIISGGFNIFPSEIEQVLWSHPAVRDCAVIGVPDNQWGEAVKAVIELNAGTSLAADDVIALCKQKLGSVKAPKSVDFVAALPRSPVGKVLKKDLRDKYWKGLERRI
jgi:acyl-CoA synthetase (AMP-forming)/AMP-acid ligase II